MQQKNKLEGQRPNVRKPPISTRKLRLQIKLKKRKLMSTKGKSKNSKPRLMKKKTRKKKPRRV